MDECFREASLALAEREVPVGCAIVDSKGHIIATGRNDTNCTRNSTRHAEIVALSRVPFDADLSECILYVTVEPCIMCASALAIVGLSRIIYYAKNDKFGGCGSVLDINEHIQSPWTKLNATFIPDERAVHLLQEFFGRKNPNTDTEHLLKEGTCETTRYNDNREAFEEPNVKTRS